MEPIYVMTSSVNKRNHARLEVYEDRVVISTECEGGLMPVYDNATCTILFSELEKVLISRGGVKFFAHHPNCLHFVVKGHTRTVDDMYRDRAFHASDYLAEGVFQFAPKTETELDEKVQTARDIVRYIEEKAQLKQ